jgi:hypothetical protein
MTAIARRTASLFVDRATQQWIVQDPEGHLWIVPISENSWEDRRPLIPNEETQLEPVPGHYKYLLHLPF